MSFTVSWDDHARTYVARFRDRDHDVRRRVPRKAWATYSLRPPTERSDRHERAALRWAADQVGSFLSLSRDGHEITMRDAYLLMRRENPRRVSDATLAKWSCDWRNLEPHVGDLRPSEIDDAAATMYRNIRESDSPTPRSRTIHNELAFLAQIVRFSARWRRITGTNSVNLIELPALDDEDSRQIALDLDEVRRLFRTPHYNAERNRQLLVFGISTMLRRRNLFGVRWEWIEGEWLTVPADEMKGRRGQKREHSLPLAAVAIESLPRPRRHDGFVWPNPDTGHPFTWVHENFKRWAEAANVRQFSPHDLRTTGNSWLQREGVDDFTRAALMGHSRTQAGTLRRSGSVTDRYTHVYRDHLRKTVSIFDQVFRDLLKD